MGLKHRHRWSVGRLVYLNDDDDDDDDDGQDDDEYRVGGDGHLNLCAQLNIAR